MSQTTRTVLFVLAVAFIGEVGLAPLLSFAGITPDFAVIAIVVLALARGAFAATLGGLALGLIQDLACPQLLGLHALAQTIVGYSCGRLRGMLLYGHPAVEGTLVALASLVHQTIYLLGESGFGLGSFLRPFLLQALPGALFTGLLGVPLLRLAARLRILDPEE
ncbi:MAG: rod shape-determining protein MreD [Candidatus Krumholzibacteriia bacterium]